MLYDTDNEWGVAALRADMQAEPIEPILSWGSRSRSREMHGTWHFYVSDDRFSSLLRNPRLLLESGPSAAVEPNITVYEQAPRWQVLAAIARKRASAREFQQLGVRVFVDLNVPRACHDLAVLGVPRGWRSYATRAYAERHDDLRSEYELAVTHAGAQPVLLVIGGGLKIASMCRQMPGCVWVEDFQTQRRLQKKDVRLQGDGGLRDG